MNESPGTVEQTPSATDLGQCPSCVKGRLRRSFIDENLTHENDDAEPVKVAAKNVPVEICDHCGEVFVDKETLRVRHESVCRTLGLLTPAEIKSIRERHQLSQADFSAITGLGEASISRWERGRLLQNRGNNAYLRTLQKHPEIVESLIREFEESRIEATDRGFAFKDV